VKDVPWRQIAPILLISLILNLCGIQWGLPEGWPHDELTSRASRMAATRSINPEMFAYGSLHY
jgi:hypothetical protein